MQKPDVGVLRAGEAKACALRGGAAVAPREFLDTCLRSSLSEAGTLSYRNFNFFAGSHNKASFLDHLVGGNLQKRTD
jgi:hypothetical protein